MNTLARTRATWEIAAPQLPQCKGDSHDRSGLLDNQVDACRDHGRYFGEEKALAGLARSSKVIGKVHALTPMNFTSQGFSFGQLDTSPDAAWQSAENLLQSIMHRLAVDCIVGLTIAMVARAQYHSVKNFPRSRAK